MTHLQSYSRACQILDRGHLFVQVDTTKPCVVVPSQFKGSRTLVLEWGWDMPKPIHDMKVSSDGLYGTLSFEQGPFCVFLPWESVVRMAPDYEGLVIGTPGEYLRAAAEGRQLRVSDTAPRPEVKKLPKGWRVIQGGKA